MADVHLGRVSVVHLKRNRDSWGKIVKNQNKQKNTEKPLLVSITKMMKQLKKKMFLLYPVNICCLKISVLTINQTKRVPISLNVPGKKKTQEDITAAFYGALVLREV